MRVKLGWSVSIWASVSLALLLGTANIQAQEATAEATPAATETALIAQFKLSQQYQDSLYTVDYPQGWVTMSAPGAVALENSQQIIDLIQKFVLPQMTSGQLGIQLMTGVIDQRLRPDAPSQLINVNCTSCHILEQPEAPLNSTESVPSLSEVASSVALQYAGVDLQFPFGSVQTIQLGAGEAAEASFASRKFDGLLIEFYANGQLVNLLALSAPGELAADQPLIEAIASTIQVANPVSAAVSTDSP